MFPVIMLFAEAPVPGNVKTDMQPVLSSIEGAELHLSIVGDVLEWLGSFKTLADIELHIDMVSDAWREFPYQRVMLAEGNRGLQILSAAEAAFGQGRQQVLVLGSGAPNLPIQYLQELLLSTADIALGPTDDGAFYAISMRKIHPLLFHDVDWSAPNILRQTIASTQNLGMTVELGREWFDIDSPADLVRLVTHPTPPRTTTWLKRHKFLSDSTKGTI